MTRLTRRSFLLSSASFGAAPLASSLSFAGSPNERLNVACIGVGGMGRSDLNSVSRNEQVRIVALCDVDAQRLGDARAKHGDARTFRDYRKLFDSMAKDVDAVVVSTPDHMHGPIAIAAMQLKKHVYCQKPIAHNLRECRRMTDLAQQHGLVTQMGTQIHAHAAYRTAVATLHSGVLGKVHRVHAWVSKSWAGPMAGRPKQADTVPEHLDWDLWLGVAPKRPFVNRIYHPAQWRGWKDFGCGTLGDMGCHIFDPVFTALGLGAPTRVVSKGPQHHLETFAADSDIHYEFDGTKHTTDKLEFRWTDGANRPDPREAQLPEGAKLPGAGSYLVGEKGVMVIPHWAKPTFYRDGKQIELPLVERDSVDHYREWSDACRGDGETTTPFSYSGPLTEAVLLGTIAGRYRDTAFEWDSAAMKFDNDAANAFVEREYRDGWQV